MLNWYLLYCKRNELERAVDNFNNQNIISYYPRGIFIKKLRGKKVKKIEPLFMNYLFVQFDAEQIASTTIRSTRGSLILFGLEVFHSLWRTLLYKT